MRTTVNVWLPEPLIDMFDRLGGERTVWLGDALALGLQPEAHPPEAVVVDRTEPGERKAQAASNLQHFFGRYWYLALTVAQLERAVAKLESEIDTVEGRAAEPESCEEKRQPVKAPRLVEVEALAEEAQPAQAKERFTDEAGADPVATAIAFGSGLLLLRPIFEAGTAESILHEIGPWWSGVAAFQYRAWALGYDRHVLKLRLAASRSEATLKERLAREAEQSWPSARPPET